MPAAGGEGRLRQHAAQGSLLLAAARCSHHELNHAGQARHYGSPQLLHRRLIRALVGARVRTRGRALQEPAGRGEGDEAVVVSECVWVGG